MNSCSACGHPKRKQIDAQLLARVHRRHIEQKFGVSVQVLKNHWKHHVEKEPEESSESPPLNAVPFAAAEGDSLADLATAQMAAVAPLPVAAALGLQPGATYRECFVQRLLLSAIQQGDTSAAKELLDRIDGKAAAAASAAERRDAIITLRYDQNELEKKLLGPIALGKTFENAITLRLEGENDTLALTAWNAMPPAMREELWAELRSGLRSLMTEEATDVQSTVQ